MSDEVYRKVARVLDTLPNGFPATETGVEIKILKKIFTPEEAEIFCDLRLSYESAADIARRTGREPEVLEKQLTSMWQRGECGSTERNGVRHFRLLPWVIGLFEFHKDRMDREFAELCQEYGMHFGAQLIQYGPRIMRVIPVEKEIATRQEALPYNRVSHIIEQGKKFTVTDCICKKEQGILDNPCQKPVDVCLGIHFDEASLGSADSRTISREEALDILDKAEEAGLVHLTTNTQTENYFICNCCGCCCGVLRAINLLETNVMTDSHYFARIDPDECTACGVCADERCQVGAIKQDDEGNYQVQLERCIGCGLCVSTCPVEAVQLVRKPEEELVVPVMDETAWMDERARQRGVDYSSYK